MGVHKSLGFQDRARIALEKFLLDHFTSNAQDLVAAFNSGFRAGYEYCESERTNNVVFEDIHIGFDAHKEEIEDKHMEEIAREAQKIVRKSEELVEKISKQEEFSGEFTEDSLDENYHQSGAM